MLIRNSKLHDRMIRNGIIYDRMIRNGTIHGGPVAPPVGRIFNVGGAGGELVLDGMDTNAPWYPLQPYDTLVIQSGTYERIDIRRMATGTGVITITSDGPVDCVQSSRTFYLRGNSPSKNLYVDFHNKGRKYGLNLTTMEAVQTMILDYDDCGGHENVTIRGVRFFKPDYNPQSVRFIYPHNHNTDGPAWNNGAGIMSFKNLSLEEMEFASETPGIGIDYCVRIGRFLTPSQDNVYHEGTKLKNLKVSDNLQGNNLFYLRNAQSVHIDHIDLGNATNQSTNHNRVIIVEGNGIIENCIGREHEGNVATFWGASRGSELMPCIIRNNIGYRSRRYSTFEIQEFSAHHISGVTRGATYKATGNLAFDNDLDGFWVGAVGDLYELKDDGEVVTSNNLRIGGNGGTSVFNNLGAPVNSLGGNEYYANNSTTLLNTDTFIPASNSALKGEGVNDPDLTHDFYGTPRQNPPTIGAVEGA